MKVLGHVLDTEHVRLLSKQRETNLAGCSASWTAAIWNMQEERLEYRVYVYSTILNQWNGVFTLYEGDLEVYPDGK